MNNGVALHAFDVGLGTSIKKYNFFSIWEEWKCGITNLLIDISNHTQFEVSIFLHEEFFIRACFKSKKWTFKRFFWV